MKKITAVDASHGRVPAVQPGRRLPAEDRVQRVRHPGRRLPRGPRRRTSRSSTKPNGTGPYKLKEWSKGNRIVWEANAALLGRQGPDARPRVPLERRGGAAPARAAVRHTSTASTTRARHDIADDPGRREPAVLRRAPGLNTLVPRLQQHDQAVRQREGPPGDRHGHRPRADRQELLPGGLDRRRLLHAVRDPVRLRRRQAVGVRPGRGQGSSSPRPASRTASRPRSSSAPRSAATCPIRRVIATEIAQQLKTNLGITATPKLLESGAMIDGLRRRAP